MPSVPGSGAAGGTGVKWATATAEAAAKTLLKGRPVFECMTRHIARHIWHDPAEDFRCDRCRAHSDTMVGVSQEGLAE